MRVCYNRKLEALIMSEVKEEIVEVEENKRWTFGNYFKGIKRFKWWVIGFTVAGAAAGYLSFKFALNPAKKKLNATFTLSLPGEFDEGSTDVIRLVDGSAFNPFSLVSRSSLQAVKDSNEAYKKVNVDKLVENGGINIEKDMKLMNQNEKEPVYYITYKISASASSFPSDKIGQKFVYDVLNNATVIAGNAVDNYNVTDCFTNNFATLDFSRKVAQLEGQYSAISKTFYELGEKFNKSSVASSEGELLSAVENKVKSNYAVAGNQSFTDELYGTLYSKKYVDYDGSNKAAKMEEIKAICRDYAETKAKKNDEISIYEAQITSLNATLMVQQDTELTKKISELSDRIAEIKVDIKNIERELAKNGYVDGTTWDDDPSDDTVLGHLAADKDDWKAGCASFKTKLDSYKTLLDADREVASSAFRYCYKTYKNDVIIQDGGYVKVDGAISSIIGLAAGLLVGFAASSLITAAIYIYKKED